MQTSTVQVKPISDLASEREIREYFSFSGEVEHIEIQSDSGNLRTAFVTLKDPKALEIALSLLGATIIDQIVSVTRAENHVPKGKKLAPLNGRLYINRAQDVVTGMLAKGSAIRQDVLNKAKAFDEKHQLTAVSAKVKSVDQRLHVSDKTMAAILAAERTLNETGSAVKTSRYVTAGAAWLNGAFGEVARTICWYKN